MRRIKRALRWVALAVVGPWLCCGTNPPTPDPGPGPVDAAPGYVFDKMVADCAADSAQSPSVLQPVALCLAGSNPVDGCMVDLLTTWPADAIACGVRFVGVQTAIARAGGDAGAAPLSAAVAARTWLLIHNVMFRN